MEIESRFFSKILLRTLIELPGQWHFELKKFKKIHVLGAKIILNYEHSSVDSFLVLVSFRDIFSVFFLQTNNFFAVTQASHSEECFAHIKSNKQEQSICT